MPYWIGEPMESLDPGPPTNRDVLRHYMYLYQTQKQNATSVLILNIIEAYQSVSIQCIQKQNITKKAKVLIDE